MRRVMSLLVVLAVCWAIPGGVVAGGLPAAGSGLTIDVGHPEFRVINVDPNTVTIAVPVLRVQYQKENIINPKWEVSASYAWTDGQSWRLVALDSYGLSTKLDGDYLIAALPLSSKGNGWYWVRVWGQDKSSGRWLWINQTSQYCRKDTAGNPGYEFLVNTRTGRYQPVPTDYSARP